MTSPPPLDLPLPSPNFTGTSDVAIIQTTPLYAIDFHDVEYQTFAVIQRLLQVSYIHKDFLKRVLAE